MLELDPSKILLNFKVQLIFWNIWYFLVLRNTQNTTSTIYLQNKMEEKPMLGLICSLLFTTILSIHNNLRKVLNIIQDFSQIPFQTKNTLIKKLILSNQNSNKELLILIESSKYYKKRVLGYLIDLLLVIWNIYKNLI